jgi:hypothetical protein
MSAPQSVQQFRRIVRDRFPRGINEDVDQVLDGILVWVVDDAISGRLTTVDEAATTVADWLCDAFPCGTVGQGKSDSDGSSGKSISRRRR